jgi:predicted esterase
VLFLYHGAGDNAENFANAFDAEGISDAFDAVVIVPYATGDYAFEWSILANDEEDVDLALFDDVLSCLDSTHNIDNTKVFATGFSAGALWTGLLLSRRAEYLAAATTFSGGIQDRVGLYTFQDPSWPLPVLSTHGGPTDEVLIKFQEATENLTERLVDGGSLVVLCTHTQGHTVTNELYSAGLNFLFAHQFGKTSPFAAGLSNEWPATCDIVK